jgi:hypothetical protein
MVPVVVVHWRLLLLLLLLRRRRRPHSGVVDSVRLVYNVILLYGAGADRGTTGAILDRATTRTRCIVMMMMILIIIVVMVGIVQSHSDGQLTPPWLYINDDGGRGGIRTVRSFCI